MGCFLDIGVPIRVPLKVMTTAPERVKKDGSAGGGGGVFWDRVSGLGW